MFKVFLVEDEIGIRESIRDTLDWESAGFEYLGDAPDGEMAVKAIRKLKPDIVITDIKMPFVDGLELSALIREELPDTRILILSGHDDFAYAQKAIRLGVAEYLLKPISPSELMQAMNRVAVEMRRELASGAKASEADAGARRQRRDAFLRDLLSDAIPPSEIFARVAELGLSFADNFYLAAAVKSDAKGFDLTRDLALAEIVSRSTAAAKGLALDKNQGEFAVIFQGETAGGLEGAAASALAKAGEEAAERLGVRLFAGVGDATERLHELSRSFREAETARNYALFTASAAPCLIKNVRREGNDPGLALAEKLDKAQEFLQCGGQADVKRFAAEIRKAAADAGGKGMALHYAYIDLLMTAAKAVRNMNVEVESVLPEFAALGEKAFAINTPEQLEAAAAAICDKVVAYRQSHLANRYRDLLTKARQFIDSHYGDPYLSLQKIAAEVHVSPTHFSAVFSRETGETFSDYVAKVRMTNAMRLLKTTALSAAEISEKVGYKDPQYFSRVFRRAAGMSIRSFRGRS